MKPLTHTICPEPSKERLFCSISNVNQSEPSDYKTPANWNLTYDQGAWVFSLQGFPQIRFQNHSEAAHFLDHFRKLVDNQG